MRRTLGDNSNVPLARIACIQAGRVLLKLRALGQLPTTLGLNHQPQELGLDFDVSAARSWL
ncbi:MAG TPA: hypothetical protein VGS19_04925 [Streptosporangiaceae bacterium]|nr:hypothetical protein [Streptosporangiaceae bacterium]